MSDSFRTIGLYVTPEIIEYLDEVLYEACGVVDVREYYDSQGAVKGGDPFAEVFDIVMRDIIGDFAELYEKADFDVSVEPDGFELVTVAASGDVVYQLRDKVEAARMIQECDSRTVHTAIMNAAIEEGYFEQIVGWDEQFS